MRYRCDYITGENASFAKLMSVLIRIANIEFNQRTLMKERSVAEYRVDSKNTGHGAHDFLLFLLFFVFTGYAHLRAMTGRLRRRYKY